MNVKQQGLGHCTTCGTPIMEAVNQPGVKGVCFGCQEAAKPKTGRTLVVRNETGETKATAGAVEGKVEFDEVENTVNNTVVKQVVKPPVVAGVNVFLSLEDLFQPDIIKTLLVKINEGIDNMPPPATIKEAKKIFGLQEKIEDLIKAMEPK